MIGTAGNVADASFDAFCNAPPQGEGAAAAGGVVQIVCVTLEVLVYGFVNFAADMVFAVFIIDIVVVGLRACGKLLDGVVDVVSRLFEIVNPTKAFFGLKDFQQVSVIRFMTSKLNLPVEIIACPTLREASGLAMSSRNMRLSETENEDAEGRLQAQPP